MNRFVRALAIVVLGACGIHACRADQGNQSSVSSAPSPFQANVVFRPPPGVTLGATEYYMVAYGLQDDQATPYTTHSFATFLATAKTQGPSPRYVPLERQDINWGPLRNRDTGVFCGGKLSGCVPEPGALYGVPHAMGLFAKRGFGMRLTRWGPFPISRAMFQAARAQANMLKQGRVLYQAADLGHRETWPPETLSCFHAVSDIMRPFGQPTPVHMGGCFGDAASYVMARHLLGSVVAGSSTEAVWPAVWASYWDGERPPIAPDKIRQGGTVDVNACRVLR